MFRFRVVGLDEVYRDIFRLWEKILEDGFKPDLIVAILRGGYFPAKVLAELFGGLNLKTVEIKFYRNIDRKEKPKIVQPLYGYVKRKKVLLVDDVTDTGKTLTLAVKHLNRKGALKVKTATIHKKVWSKIKPDYYVYEVD
ncbi:MAG: phosphoribosyltransferase [Candidatus Hecatellales archaeon]|nr:MAG: phosphoribosyltransferase [Candidatus Hecatellales archaeon]